MSLPGQLGHVLDGLAYLLSRETQIQRQILAEFVIESMCS